MINYNQTKRKNLKRKKKIKKENVNKDKYKEIGNRVETKTKRIFLKKIKKNSLKRMGIRYWMRSKINKQCNKLLLNSRNNKSTIKKYKRITLIRKILWVGT